MSPKNPAGPPFKPPEIIPDSLEVPEKTLMLVPDCEYFNGIMPDNLVPLEKDRGWFTPYFYLCLPLVVGNQLGFVVRATHDMLVRWDGGADLPNLEVHDLEPPPNPVMLTVKSHFGSGILTIQTRYVFRTPKGVNLVVKQPPNFFIDGLTWMDAVVETDQLRRDFTFNVKATRKNADIVIPRGTPLGCVVPYPRYFADDYKLELLQDKEELQKAWKTIEYFSIERKDHDSSPRLRYMKGEDIYGIMFEHHQKSLDGGAWWDVAKNSRVAPLPAEPEPAAVASVTKTKSKTEAKSAETKDKKSDTKKKHGKRKKDEA